MIWRRFYGEFSLLKKDESWLVGIFLQIYTHFPSVTCTYFLIAMCNSELTLGGD